jgi:hypothetical protein
VDAGVLSEARYGVGWSGLQEEEEEEEYKSSGSVWFEEYDLVEVDVGGRLGRWRIRSG